MISNPRRAQRTASAQKILTAPSGETTRPKDLSTITDTQNENAGETLSFRLSRILSRVVHFGPGEVLTPLNKRTNCTPEEDEENSSPDMSVSSKSAV